MHKKEIHTRTDGTEKENGAKNAEGAAFQSSYTKAERVLAVLALLAIGIVLILLLLTVFSGGPAKQLLALLFCLIVIPCILYAFRLYLHYTTKRRKK